MRERAGVLTVTDTSRLEDERLAQRVRLALNVRGLSGSPLHVQVKDGILTLRGVVATYPSKAQILHTVRNVPGVIQAQDELWV
jgi:osmotically-inducible protein OsmY